MSISGYNPPEFIMNAAKEAVTKVDSNQYSPTTGRPSLKRAIAESYSEALETRIDPDTEVTITTGANEGSIRDHVDNKQLSEVLRLAANLFARHVMCLPRLRGRGRRSHRIRAVL